MPIKLDNGEMICRVCWDKTPDEKTISRIQRRKSHHQEFSYWGCRTCGCGSSNMRLLIRHLDHNNFVSETKGRPKKSWGAKKL